ncbi:hypothetical protein B0H14DRAFT_3485836 [Mycena olivaceomarginata]|nr:hypothetical protein B0H14DRAFT_3485836 [Mycena olivaceomarginata]
MAPLCAALPSAVLGGLTDPIIAACCARPSKLEAGDCGRRLLEHTIAPDPRQRHCYSTRRSLSPDREKACALSSPLSLHTYVLRCRTYPCTCTCLRSRLKRPPHRAPCSARRSTSPRHRQQH